MVKRYGEGASRNPGHIHPDLVDAGARGDVERLVIGVAELAVCGEFGRGDRAEMLASRRDTPAPAGGRLPDIALDVDFQAVGDAGRRILADVDEHDPVRQGAVRLDVVTLDVFVAAAV